MDRPDKALLAEVAALKAELEELKKAHAAEIRIRKQNRPLLFSS